MTTVLKLGGSVITEKDSPETVDEAALSRCVAAIGDSGGWTRAGTGTGTKPGTADGTSAPETDAGGSLVVVHGGGSFGHHHADAHGVTETAGTTEAGAVTDIHGAMKRLNDAVVGALGAEGVPAVPVHPFSLARRDEGGDLSLPVAGVEAVLAEGFVPVLHGDVVVHAGRGATILSGDELVVALAAGLGSDRVGLCAGVPGVLDAEGRVVDRIDRFADVADALGGSDATDVTGGMAGKVRALLSLSAPARVFGPDDLAGFLAGDPVGTRIGGTDGAPRDGA